MPMIESDRVRHVVIAVEPDGSMMLTAQVEAVFIDEASGKLIAVKPGISAVNKAIPEGHKGVEELLGGIIDMHHAEQNRIAEEAARAAKVAQENAAKLAEEAAAKQPKVAARKS